MVKTGKIPSTWIEVTGTLWISAPDDEMYGFFSKPIDDNIANPRATKIHVSILRKEGYDIPDVPINGMRVTVWFDVRKNKILMDMLTGKNLKLAREHENK